MRQSIHDSNVCVVESKTEFTFDHKNNHCLLAIRRRWKGEITSNVCFIYVLRTSAFLVAFWKGPLFERDSRKNALVVGICWSLFLFGGNQMHNGMAYNQYLSYTGKMPVFTCGATRLRTYTYISHTFLLHSFIMEILTHTHITVSLKAITQEKKFICENVWSQSFGNISLAISLWPMKLLNAWENYSRNTTQI